eukprot:15426097-Alexandrium_andersonii.AAC.1
MSTSEICWALQPDLQWEKLMYFHAFTPVDLQPFDELNFPNGMPSEPTGTSRDPQDKVANFGMFKGELFSNMLLNHF